MKKAATKRKLDPGAASLPEMPEIDFAAFRVRRNPYAGRIAREGLEIAHHGPSAASLAEIPEADFARSRVRPNQYAAKAVAAASNVQYGKGRPLKGAEVGPTPARSLRLPEALWHILENEARERATTVHALLREVVVTHVSNLRPTPAAPKKKQR
jgi:hypothetical protein